MKWSTSDSLTDGHTSCSMPITNPSVHPYSLHIFLPGGNPEGLRVIERDNRPGLGLVCPRAYFREAKSRPEFSRAGVYILVGPSDAGELPKVYVGEGDPVLPRLEEHYRNRDFWTWLVVFTTKDESHNKAHVQHLEARLLELARETRRCELKNNNKPQRPALTDSQTAAVESYLSDMLGILPLIGLPVFEKPTSRERSQPVLQLKGRGVVARGFESGTGFVVLGGSTAAAEAVPSLLQHVPHAVALRQALLDQGVLLHAGGELRFTQDFPFSSPSTAADVVLGRSANGRLEWKDEQGRSLRDLQDPGAL